MKKYARQLILVGMIFLIIVVGGIVFVISCIPTSGDHDRAVSLARDIESNYAFRATRKDGGGPAVYVTGLSYSDHLSIYGDYSEPEVVEILLTVSEAQSRRADKKTIYAEFSTIELDSSTLYKKAKIRK